MIIYKIVNDINDKIYIGQTIKSLSERIRGYKKEIYSFENSIRKGRPIIHAMSKHGFENFHFHIIDSAETIEELNELETYYIDHYNSLTANGGYNAAFGGGNRRLTEEAKKKISIANTGKPSLKGYDHPVSREVVDLTTGIKYGSTKEAERELGISKVRDCAIGLCGSAHGRIFKYTDEERIVIDESHIKPDINIYNKVITEYRQYLKPSSRPNQNLGKILHIESGNIYNSTRHAAENTPVSRQSVSDVLNGVKDSIKGQSFRYLTKEEEEVMLDELCTNKK